MNIQLLYPTPANARTSALCSPRHLQISRAKRSIPVAILTRVVTPSCLTTRLALTHIAAAQSRLSTLLHCKRQSRMLGHGLDLLAPVGFVVQDDVAAAAPDVCTHRGKCHPWVDELYGVSI
jgi:hypothetical protein